VRRFTQHSPFDGDDDVLKVQKDLVEILIPRFKSNFLPMQKLFNDDITYINPTGNL
jgi:S-adenosylmethionine synthetase